MVLGPRNVTKHNVKESAPIKSLDSVTERVSASLREASRRRRRRVSGSQNIQFESVQTRDGRTRNVFLVKKTRPQTRIPLIQCAQMSDAPKTSPPTIPVSLPRRLARPTFKPISPVAIEAAVPGVESAQYVLDRLPLLIEEMSKGVLAAQIPASRTSTVPTKVEVEFNALQGVDIPTHVMLVYNSGAAETNHAIFSPVHHIVLAAHCANLPPMKTIPVEVTPTAEGSRATLPVQPLGVPVPELFSLLSAFLYHKSPMPVFRALLPQDFSISGGDWSGPTFSAAAQAAPIRVLGQRLSDTQKLDSILQSIAKTHGMWRNVCALGIFDPAVWHTLDIVWEILLTALSFSTNQPELMACS